MAKKSFVSLYFTHHKLQVLKLNSKKTSVEKFLSVDLPQGMVVNYEVKDKDGLVKILQSVWSKWQIKEKTVGIVVPEFSTFSKSLMLPKLPLADLDEAVRWQSQEFLPDKKEEMVMDWKVVKKEGENFQILAVAILEKLLLSYVNAVAEAELFPLVVETPSISLSRIADHKPSGKLIIYANFGEAILTLAQGEEILGTSVISSRDQRGMLETAKRMVSYYQSLEIDRVEIGGPEIGQEFLNNLPKALNKPVTWIENQVKGMKNEEIHQYLVPLSLQYKDPAEPLSEETINLLPGKWVKYYQKKSLNFKIWGLSIIASIVIFSCFLITLGAFLMFNRQLTTLEKIKNSQAAGLSGEIKEKILGINALADKTDQIITASKTPQELVELINQNKSMGIIITDYLMDLESGKVVLKGMAANRQELIKFKQTLNETEKFSQITMPLSTYEAETDINFELRMIYGEAIKSKSSKIIKLKL